MNPAFHFIASGEVIMYPHFGCKIYITFIKQPPRPTPNPHKIKSMEEAIDPYSVKSFRDI